MISAAILCYYLFVIAVFDITAYDDVRGVHTSLKAGRDRNKDENSTDSPASKGDKRSQESVKGSRGDKDSDSESRTSYSSSSSSSSSPGK